MSIHEKRNLLLCLLPLSLAGCAPALIATGAVAGYAMSRDAVVLDMNRPWDRIWNAADEEVRALGGRMKREHPGRGRIDARVEEADVVITLKRLNDETVRVVVRARKNMLPKIDVAQKLAFGIQRRVESGSGG